MTSHRTADDVAAAHSRGLDEGIAITIAIVRDLLTPDQQHQAEQRIAALLAQPIMAGAAALLEQTPDHPAGHTKEEHTQ